MLKVKPHNPIYSIGAKSRKKQTRNKPCVATDRSHKHSPGKSQSHKCPTLRCWTPDGLSPWLCWWTEMKRHKSEDMAVENRFKHVESDLWPPLGSQTLGSVAPWRGRRACSTPAPRSESRRWTPWRCPTCCPSCGWSVSPSAGSARFQAEMQGRPELWVGEEESPAYFL